MNRKRFGAFCTEVLVYILFVLMSSRACICTCFGASSKFLAMMTFAMVLLSLKVSVAGDLLADPNAGRWRKYESCRVVTGEFERVGLCSTDNMAWAKSSRLVCSWQSTTALERPKTFEPTCNLLEREEYRKRASAVPVVIPAPDHLWHLAPCR